MTSARSSVSLRQRVVQRPRLVARPVLQVRELDVVPRAPRLDRPPQALVVGVVVDQDDLVARVVEAHQRAERVDDHVRRLVVRRDVQADERKLADRGQLRGRDRRDLPVPGLRADRVADLPQVGAGQDRGEQLEEPQQQPAGRRWPGRGGCRTSTPARRPGRRRTGRCWSTSTGGPRAFQRRVTGSQIRLPDDQAGHARRSCCARSPRAAASPPPRARRAPRCRPPRTRAGASSATFRSSGADARGRSAARPCRSARPGCPASTSAASTSPPPASA